MKTALVTGSSGFIGRHLVPRLSALGYDLTLVDPVVYPGHKQIVLTFEEFKFLTPCSDRFDVVIHLAASLTKTNIEQRNKLGVGAFNDVALDMEMARYLDSRPPRQRAIWLSSCAVDAHEYENYAFVKYVGERFAMNLAKQGVPITILRPYGGYGPGQSLDYPFPAILSRAMRRENPLVVWGSLETTRDWIYVDDIIDAIIEAIDAKDAGPHLIGTGRAVTFGELARMMADVVGYSPTIIADESKPIGSKHRVCPVVRHVNISLEEGIKRCMEAMQCHSATVKAS